MTDIDLRLPVEADRARFVGLFADEEFMVFSDGVLDEEAGHRRFDEMLVRAAELPFAKQPVVERATGTVLGYVGVNWFDFESERRLEFGWRLVPEGRGRGYATEAAGRLLAIAGETFSGTILAMIDPLNLPSQRVADKLGFTFWKEAVVDGWLDRLYRIDVGRAESGA